MMLRWDSVEGQASRSDERYLYIHVFVTYTATLIRSKAHIAGGIRRFKKINQVSALHKD